ncbi:hypothetical protein D9M70_519960 [compost metagenome]
MQLAGISASDLHISGGSEANETAAASGWAGSGRGALAVAWQTATGGGDGIARFGSSDEKSWVFDEATGTFVDPTAWTQVGDHAAKTSGAGENDADASEQEVLNGIIEWEARKGLLSRLVSLFGGR